MDNVKFGKMRTSHARLWHFERSSKQSVSCFKRRHIEEKTQALTMVFHRADRAHGLPEQAGLVHFTRSMAPKLATRGIRLCALCPQPVDTPMVSTMMSMGLPLPETGSSLLTPSRV